MNAAGVHVTRDIAVDHPAFAGHFPGQPVLPGVVLLAEVLEAVQAVPELAARLGSAPGFAVAKFHAPVRPGSTITIALHESASGARFEVHCSGPHTAGALLAASGQLEPGAAT